MEVTKRVMVVLQRPVPPKGQEIERELELGLRSPGSQRFSLITPESDLLLRKMTASILTRLGELKYLHLSVRSSLAKRPRDRAAGFRRNSFHARGVKEVLIEPGQFRF